ncbi:hypothetical protein MATR_00690 [Marivirga tractuosa]|uniref:Alkyl hydroperoxide reductase/ Thiol specific antioxidant/ Mal allergen n=1 Tax=Marivirga tractuosa (strain ATCC 23168 / DSM 4126 / NBRC 15989 / NCIMB 1408 / VKM B-1430 / H-43) TaxID=643867 RepID=E4TLI6_MARTH|nr:TlpA disulfide reductase family protein [Marivirga tractuosa]ADR22290.1 alkyl hydroperoxide reductase/ Thiol specific antioxidant/ Mal allergen [Marivirga tractuosa DSM 4126]BDD13244.1 hypothetical protein MATR_00690 [Marivirga tractuosa]
MKKIICTSFALIIGFSLMAKSGKLVLTGAVQNQSATTIAITDLNNQKIASAELDENGDFSMSFKLEYDGYYSFDYGRNATYIYLYPKDELHISFDANNFESTLTFEGKGATRNNYLANKSNVQAELTKDLEAFYKVSETDYLENLANVKTRHEALLATYDVQEFFRNAEKRALEYNRLLNIQNYKTSYKFYLGEDISPSDEFYAPISSVDLGDEEEYKKQPYYRYLVNSVWSDRIAAASDVDGMLGVLSQVSSQAVLISLVNGFYSKISSSEDRAKDYLNLIKRVTTHQPFIDAAEKRYQEVISEKGLTQGDISPEFNYETVDGNTVSLSDLKGKYVYIDVWATWCGPCIKQIPYLKELEELYQDKNVVFVSISVDKETAKNKWKKMIAEKELGGLQLFADKSFDSEFMEAYAVNSIPRFILIDPDGKIVNPEAPRPSFQKTRKLLDSLLK